MGRLKELRKYVNSELNKMEDADVIHHCMNNISKAINENEQARFEKLCGM